MPVRFEMQSNVTRSGRARELDLRDHLFRTAEARRRQAEAIAAGVRRLWTSARRALERLANGKSRERRPAANDKDLPETRAGGGADAFRRWRLSPLRLLRRHILEPYARWRRRRIAIDQLRALDDRLLADIGLTRGQIPLAVDGLLASRGEPTSRPLDRAVHAEDAQHELPMAA